MKTLLLALVLAVIGGSCGAIGGAAVGAGLSVGEASTRSKRNIALVFGAAFGGTVVGLAVQWLTRWSLATLVGLTLESGGGIEGLVIGGAAGLGYAIAKHTGRRWHAPGLIAALCGVGAFALILSGRPLVGGTLHACRDVRRLA